MYYPSIPPEQLSDLRRWLETELHALGAVYNNGFAGFDEQIGLRETAGTGVIEGGLLTINTSTTINIGAGAGEIVDGYTDRRAPTVTNVNWPDTLGFVIDMPNQLGIQVIYVDEDGVIHQQVNSLTPTQRRHNVQLGFVSYDSGIVETADEGGIWSNEVANVLYDWVYFTAAEDRIQGMGIHPTLTNLSIWGETGKLLSPGINIESSLTDANILPFNAVGGENTPVTFRIVYSDGSMHSLNQTIMPDLYEVSPGVTGTIIGNHAVIHYIYRTHGNDIIVQLGQTSYTDAKLARDSLEVDRQEYTYFTNAEQTLLSAQSYHGAQATNYDDPNKAGIVSLIGTGSNPSGGINITEFLALLDVYATTYDENAGHLVMVNPEETGLVLIDPDEYEGFVSTAGDTMTGDLSLPLNPDIEPAHAVRQDYISGLISGALVYQGAWNAATNTPLLADGTGTGGHFYRVTVPGTRDLGSGVQVFKLDDLVIYDSSSQWKGLTPAHNYVLKTGDTMSGNLVVGDGTTGNMMAVRSFGAGNAHYWLRRADDTAAGLFYASIGDDTVRLRKYAADGTTVETDLVLLNNGNVSLTGGSNEPTAVAHLTRKDYVDNNFLSKTTTVDQQMNGKLQINKNLVVDPIYNQGQLELRSGDGSEVVMGFHRGGLTACQLRHESTGLILSSTSRTGVADFVATGNMFINAAQSTAVNALTRKDYVDNKILGAAFSGTGVPIWNPHGFTLLRLALGQYELAHNLGTTNFSFQVTATHAQPANGNITCGLKNNTSTTILSFNTFNTDGTLLDGSRIDILFAM